MSVFIYVPNIIGYIRILLLCCSSYYIFEHHRLALLLYLTSCLLDAFDGLAARLFNQSSLFGSMLDMLTDRVSTICLLMALSHMYPSHFFIIQALLVVDVVSHWLHFFSASLQGKASHKSSDGESNFLMRIYYENKLILTTVCALEQLFYCALLGYKYEDQNYMLGVLAISLPGLLFKNCINFLQIIGACRVMANIDRASLYHTD